MDLIYKAERHKEDKHQYAFVRSSLPNPDDEVIDGNLDDGLIDGNDR